jgi:acetoin utilization deacetylase AcuC-like enzyme
MGFCLFNNIAVAAKYAQKTMGLKRVLIIDWDVHHGNGTQDIFYDDPSVCFASFHQYPFWPPNSGWYEEDGTGEGKGYNVNIPLPAGTGDRGYLHAWDRLLKPICLEYQPELIMLSAGYDAHQMDPLGQQRISTSGYAMLSQRLADLGRETSSKLVAFLEGGYNAKSLAESALATMRVLNASTAEETAAVHVSYLVPGSAAGMAPITEDQSPNEVDQRVVDVRKHFSQYWRSLK